MNDERLKKLRAVMTELGIAGDDLAEQPDDEFEQHIDDWMSMIALIANRGYTGNAPDYAAKLLTVVKLDRIETALLSFNDNVMLHLKTGGLPMKIPSTEELLKHYNPEVLELIKDGTAEMEIYEDRVVITKPVKSDGDS